MTESQQNMISSLQEVQKKFNPKIKGKGVLLKEKINNQLVEWFECNGDFLTIEERLALISMIELNETSPFIKELYSLMDLPDGEYVEEAFVKSFASILLKIANHLSEQTGNKKTFLPLLEEYIAFHGKLSL